MNIDQSKINKGTGLESSVVAIYSMTPSRDELIEEGKRLDAEHKKNVREFKRTLEDEFLTDEEEWDAVVNEPETGSEAGKKLQASWDACNVNDHKINDFDRNSKE